MEVEAARLWLRAKSEPPPRHAMASPNDWIYLSLSFGPKRRTDQLDGALARRTNLIESGMSCLQADDA